MLKESSQEPDWLEPLCRIALLYRTGSLSIRELFENAGPNLEDSEFVELVARTLAREPGLVAAWQQFSSDTRATPNPYLAGTQVGFIDSENERVRKRVAPSFATEIDACSVYIRDEAAWVLHRREPNWLDAG